MYRSDDLALRAYARTQEIIFSADCDLSTYRIRYEDVPHVVVLGLTPPENIDRQIGQTLASGEPSQLPADILQTLDRRRRQANRLGPWVEGHYRPSRNVC